MIKTHRLFIPVMMVLALYISCDTDDVAGDQILKQGNVYQLSKNHKDFLEVNHINSKEAYITFMETDNGQKEKVFISDDIVINYSEYKKWMDDLKSGIINKQYKSRYTVQPLYRRFTVVAGPSLNRRTRVALQEAVRAINDLGTTLRISIKYSGSGDVMVSLRDIAEAGRADLPSSSGRPGSRIWINRTIATNTAFGYSNVKHVMLHELCHTLGLVHQDWRNRESCGGGRSDNGFVEWIPGTPQSSSENSIMQACYGPEAPTVLTSSDKRALNILY